MSAMNDDDLSRLLRELPRRDARPEFTGRVLSRLDAPARQGWRRAWMLAAGCAVLIGIWLGVLAWREHHERRVAAHRLEQKRLRMMQSEYRALELELEELRALASDAQPVLELGGTENVDFVFDLRRHAEEHDRARARPTSHSRQ